MTIIVTKPDIIIDVVGSYFYIEGLRVSLVHVHACVRGVGLLLNPSEAFAY